MLCTQLKAFFFVSIMFSVVLGSATVVKAEVALDKAGVTHVTVSQTAETNFIMEEVDSYSIRVFQNSCIVESQVVSKGFPAESPKKCTKTVVTSAEVAVSCGGGSLKLSSSPQGIVSLPPSLVGYIETTPQIGNIVWQFAGASITTHANVTTEQRQATISKYLNNLSDSNLFSIQLSELSDFDKSANKLKNKIRESMSKYYHLQKVATNDSLTVPAQVAYQLVPGQQRMYYTYGDFTGNAELPIIAFSDSPPAVLVRTSIINSLLPAYQNEDRNIIVSFKKDVVRITNKTTAPLQLDRLSISYNGTFVDNILDRPLNLAPSATSDEISVTDIIEQKFMLRAKQSKLSAQEAQRMKINFGFGAAYHDLQSKATARTSLVNTYSVYELVKNNEETARLDDHLAFLTNDRSIPPSELQLNLKAEFDTGKYSIRKEYLNALQRVGMTMQKYPKTELVVEGHTDNVGDKKMNWRLSERRALAVKQHLVQTFGINASRIQTAGFGLSRPVADNSSAAGRRKNRRIEAAQTCR